MSKEIIIGKVFLICPKGENKKCHIISTDNIIIIGKYLLLAILRYTLKKSLTNV